MALRSPNSFADFRGYLQGGNEPAVSNLFNVIIGVPPVMQNASKRMSYRQIAEANQFLASEVTVPSRNLMVSEVKDIGAQRRYATGQSISEVTISFLVTKDQALRDYFENWIHRIGSDSENRVSFYEQAICDIYIQKWEKGSPLIIKDGLNSATRVNQATAVYQLFGAYPFNISTQTLNNDETQLMKMDVQFYYERYRFDQVNTLHTKMGGKDIVIDRSSAIGASKFLNKQVNSLANSILGSVAEQADVADFGI